MMRAHRLLTAGVLAACLAVVLSPAPAFAAEAPVKEILSSQIGLEVDKTTGGNLCTVAKNECQPGKRGSKAGTFEYPEPMAGARDGNVYVADRGNHRIQELSATGQFILMFGWDVNKTKIEEAAKGATVTQQQKNVCKAGEECQAGSEGEAPEQFGESIHGLAVAPATGDVYVADRVKPNSQLEVRERVQEFSPEGHLILEIGKEVNETKVDAVKGKGGTPTQKELEEENLCAVESFKCTAAAPYNPAVAKSEPGAFVLIGGLSAGGPEGRLYVGELNGIQEFDSSGEPVREPAEAITSRLKAISPAASSLVSGIAVDSSCSLHNPALTESTIPTCKEYDGSYGEVYLTYEVGFTTGVIRKFEPDGTETELPLTPRTEGNTMRVDRFAVDPNGRPAVIEEEGESNGNLSLTRGVLYTAGAAGLHRLTEFAMPSYQSYSAESIAFNGDGDMYASSEQPGHEVAVYTPVPVGELEAGPAQPVCGEGAESETDATVQCTLSAHVDPWGVPQTEAWLEWGTGPSLGEKTARQAIKVVKAEGEEETATEVSAVLQGLRPNESLDYQLAGEDRNVLAPELLTSERAAYLTPSVPPRIVGQPSVPFVHSSSATMFGHLNPENTPTEYAFQYAPSVTCASLAEACPELRETKTLEAPGYGTIATTLEAVELQSATTYRYRLFGVNKHGQQAIGENGGAGIPEGTFTTASAPVPLAITGGYSALGATSATISGVVNPDGQPATYAFEVGVARGAGTQYGIVLSGSAGASSVPVEQRLTLTGLQPGTEYAYRIRVSSGYGTAYGATATFTTIGLPALLQSPIALEQLAVPPIAFPVEAKASTSKPLTSAQKRAKALTACKKKAKKQRAACQKQARKKYPKSKQANNPKKG